MSTIKFDTTIVQDRFDSPLGSIIIAASPKGLAGLWFDGQRHLPKELLAPTLVAARTARGLAGRGSPDASPLSPVQACASRLGAAGSSPSGAEPSSPSWPTDTDNPVIKNTKAQLTDYFTGSRNHFDIALDLSGGTPFQQSVWQALLGIPRGATASYGELSARIGKPAAVRAVGAAVGRNPISIVVPCHRVMGADGSLTGYAGGLARKSSLLRLEGVALAAGQ